MYIDFMYRLYEKDIFDLYTRIALVERVKFIIIMYQKFILFTYLNFRAKKSFSQKFTLNNAHLDLMFIFLSKHPTIHRGALNEVTNTACTYIWFGITRFKKWILIGD